MLKKIPIRLRLTVLSILMLTLCCVGLTAILNLSANRMANEIEAILLIPSQPANADKIPPEINQKSESIPMAPAERSKSSRNDFLYNSIFYMFLIVMLGGALTYYISGKALKPLQDLSKQMKNRNVHNLSERLPVPKSHDEIADLSQSFNEMSKKLEAAFSMQKRFSQSAAHELRTPLAVLKTKVDVFKKKPNHTSEEYGKLLSVISTHTNRLTDLVNDLLDLTNMEGLNCNEQITLRTIFAEISDELSACIEEKHITITLDGPEQTLVGNRILLYRAFYNLVENAIKYNVEDGSVNISLSTEKRKSKITISNTGSKIPVNLQKQIFEPFFRVDKSRSRQMGGAGLGLSTVKVIVEKHHGIINVDSNSSGTTFEVVL